MALQPGMAESSSQNGSTSAEMYSRKSKEHRHRESKENKYKTAVRPPQSLKDGGGAAPGTKADSTAAYGEHHGEAGSIHL